MEAQFESPRFNPLFIACVIWAAGLLATLTALLVYIAIHTYDPSETCDEVFAKTEPSRLNYGPPDIDAWDNWELLCGYYD